MCVTEIFWKCKLDFAIIQLKREKLGDLRRRANKQRERAREYDVLGAGIAGGLYELGAEIPVRLRRTATDF